MNKYDKYKFRFSITDDKYKYLILLSKYNNEYDLVFIKSNNLDDIDIDSSILKINEEDFNNFFDKLLSIVSSWKLKYNSKKQNNYNWSLILNEGEQETKYLGVGDFPENWDSFIELVMQYEYIFKTNISTPTKEDTKKEKNQLPISTMKEFSLEYSIVGLGTFEKTDLSGLKIGDVFSLGDLNPLTVKVLDIKDMSVILEIEKNLNLGSPIKEESDEYDKRDSSYIIECERDEEIIFDPFILPSTKYKIIVTGVYETIKDYYE